MTRVVVTRPPGRCTARRLRGGMTAGADGVEDAAAGAVSPPSVARPAGGPASARAAVGTGTWVVLPTYDEAENLEGIATAILDTLPGATLLVVDDSSPDGTGDLADILAARDPRVRVRHRPAKAGLGRAYLDGFAIALASGATVVVQMDADWSHDPGILPALIEPVERGDADLVIGSRYTQGGAVSDWGVARRLISRGGSVFARIVLGLRPHDITGGFKAWRGETPCRGPLPRPSGGGPRVPRRMGLPGARP